MEAGREVDLTATEYELLRVFSLEARRVVTDDALLRKDRGRVPHVGIGQAA